MIIESVHVKSFRSILDETLRCESLTALVGANGAGKSSFLHAIDLFYSLSPKIDDEDFYNGDTSSEIVISITFKNLSTEAKDLFAGYLQGEKLTVERVFKKDNGKVSCKYHGASLQNPAFDEIWQGMEVKDRGKTAKVAYEQIKILPEYADLPSWSTLGAVSEGLKQWQSRHLDKCVRKRDDGQFFGFKEVGQGYLGRFTKFLFVPAVRDAYDDTIEGRGSVLTALMDLVVRSVIANKDAVKKLREETQQKYQKIMDPANLTELNVLAEQMTNTLVTFVPNAKVDLRWLPMSEIDIPMPQADVKLIEDGYTSAVMRTGHGLQRAFILTMLQHLALAQTSSNTDQNPENPKPEPKLPNLVLAIEEPELYQHPNRQRHLAKILLQLASGKTPGVAEKTQVIYGTHSPFFVGIDRIDQLRLLRKTNNGEDKPKITKVISTSLDSVAEAVWKADDTSAPQYTGVTIAHRLQAIMTPWMSEGFFSDVVVLVEGEDDRAAILGAAKAMGHELEGSGYSVIPCGGKTNIDRPYVIFKKLGIPVYIIWDGDFGKGASDGKCEKCGRPLDKKPDPKENRRLLRLLGQTETDWPESIEDTFACFKYDLENTLIQEIGPDFFEQSLNECQSDFCILKRKHAIKNPNVILHIITKAAESGRISNTITTIINNILALK